MGYTNNKCGIYRIFLIGSDKTYIGLTKGFSGRKYQHIRILRLNNHFNFHLQRAFNKYGENNYRIELIEECDANELSEKEKHYIKIYDAFENGYNLTTGGEKCNISEEVKKRISEKNKGKILKEETKQKLREINFGKKQSQETKNKISKYIKNRVLTNEQIKKMSEGGMSIRTEATKQKMSKSRIGYKITNATKLKLIAYNLKRTRPNNKIEIKNGDVYIDDYKYVKGKRTPLEQDIFLREKEKRKVKGIEKARKSQTGQKRSIETKEKISKALKGKKRTLEQNKANSERQKGIKRSEEFKQKLRDYYIRKKEKNGS
jgi:group I intron endonuclease